MKHLQLLFLGLLLNLCILGHLSAQNNCTIAPTESPFGPLATHQFYLNNTCQGPASLYLFGDGHFSIQNNPIHQFHIPQPGNTTTEVMAVDRYKPSRPKGSAIIINHTTPNYGSSTANVWMNGNTLNIGESWSAALDNELVYILSFS